MAFGRNRHVKRIPVTIGNFQTPGIPMALKRSFRRRYATCDQFIQEFSVKSHINPHLANGRTRLSFAMVGMITTFASIGLTSCATADIVQFGKAETIPGFTSIDINGDDISDFTLNANGGQLSFDGAGLTGLRIEAGVIDPVFFQMVQHLEGEMINADAPYSFYTAGGAEMKSKTNALFSFRYDAATPGFAPLYNYGWFGASFDGTTWSFLGGAYEQKTGVGIGAGATGVPEPGSICLLAAGAGLLGLCRRRRPGVCPARD